MLEGGGQQQSEGISWFFQTHFFPSIVYVFVLQQPLYQPHHHHSIVPENEILSFATLWSCLRNQKSRFLFEPFSLTASRYRIALATHESRLPRSQWLLCCAGHCEYSCWSYDSQKWFVFKTSGCFGPLSSSKDFGDIFLKRQSSNQVSQDPGLSNYIQCFHNLSYQPVVTGSGEITCLQGQSLTTGINNSEQGVTETLHLQTHRKSHIDLIETVVWTSNLTTTPSWAKLRPIMMLNTMTWR